MDNGREILKFVTGKYYGQWSRSLKFSLLRTALEIIFSKVRIVFLCTSRVWLAKLLWK